MIALVLGLSLAVPVVDVDGRDLASDARARRITGHVIERLLEAGIAVDPDADVSVTLAVADEGYVVGLRARDSVLETATIATDDRQAAVVELELVQVAVDLARTHASELQPGTHATHVASTPAARLHHATLLDEVTRAGAIVVPHADDAQQVICLDARDGGVVVATGETLETCTDALGRAGVFDAVDVAFASIDAPRDAPRTDAPAAPPDPTPESPPPRPNATRPQARPSRAPWSLGGRVGLGFGWRPNAVDAAPALGFDAASPRGLAFGVEATWLPTRSDAVTSVDTLLAAGIGYRGTFGRIHLSVVPSGGASIHAARVGADRSTRVDPLVLLPIQLEGRVHRRVALGARLSAASTFRARTHQVRGLEVWRRGAVLVMFAVTARFGT